MYFENLILTILCIKCKIEYKRNKINKKHPMFSEILGWLEKGKQLFVMTMWTKVYCYTCKQKVADNWAKNQEIGYNFQK